mgnify:CR=1 FL=1
MILNEEYSFHDVRHPHNARSRLDYDVELSFTGEPEKVRLEAGTRLLRLDFPIVSGIFMKTWWMKREVFDSLLDSPDAATLRREWQHGQAMPKASKGVRTLVVEIQLTEPVYAWVGRTAPLFNKQGGLEQVYLPNLARGAGPDHSAHARLLHTYTLPAS